MYIFIYLLIIIAPRCNFIVAHICLGKILKQKKITKYRFAKLVGVEYPNVVKYFKQGYDPRLSTVERWAKALNVSVKDLIED